MQNIWHCDEYKALKSSRKTVYRFRTKNLINYANPITFSARYFRVYLIKATSRSASSFFNIYALGVEK